jgi:hypothetical protein
MTEMGRACSTYGEDESCIQGLDEYLEYSGVDGSIILK